MWALCLTRHQGECQHRGQKKEEELQGSARAAMTLKHLGIPYNLPRKALGAVNAPEGSDKGR